MKKFDVYNYVRVFSICALLFAGLACTTNKDSKIPITTSSEEARQYFLQGRDLADKLRVQESLQYFEKAVAADGKSFWICKIPG